MAKIIKNIVKNPKSIYGFNNGRKTITLHETDNTNKGANAIAHGKLQQNGFGSSWHYTVDDKQIVQSYIHAAQCYHAGDGRGNGNLNSIGIEICVNSDGNYKKAIENAVWLVKKIMKEENIPLKDVVQHNNWSGKNCPRNLRSGSKGITWKNFKNMVANKPAGSSTPTPPVKPTQSNKLTVDGYWGKATTRALQKALKTPIDGVISGQYSNSVTRSIPSVSFSTRNGSSAVRALQRRLKIKADGYIGADTVRALQRYLKTHIDGKISKPSTMVRELQRRLNAGTF